MKLRNIMKYIHTKKINSVLNIFLEGKKFIVAFHIFLILNLYHIHYNKK